MKIPPAYLSLPTISGHMDRMRYQVVCHEWPHRLPGDAPEPLWARRCRGELCRHGSQRW